MSPSWLSHIALPHSNIFSVLAESGGGELESRNKYKLCFEEQELQPMAEPVQLPEPRLLSLQSE